MPGPTQPPFYVVNLHAHGGGAARRWPRLLQSLTARGLLGDFAITASTGDGYRLAQEAMDDGHDAIVAVGGDGTIYEVANAVIDAGANDRVAVGTIQLGTGMDVARGLGMARPAAAIRAIAERAVRTIDVGRVDAIDATGNPVTRHFLVEASAGWVPDVSFAVPRSLKRLGGSAPYLLTAFVRMVGSMGRDFIVQVDDSFHDGRYNTVSIHNMETWGGGLVAAPGASPEDGLFDVIRWADLGRGSVFRAVRGQRDGGTHIDMDGVDHHQARTVSLASGRRTRIDLDGEFGGYLPAKFTVVPRMLRFLAPPADVPA